MQSVIAGRQNEPNLWSKGGDVFARTPIGQALRTQQNIGLDGSGKDGRGFVQLDQTTVCLASVDVDSVSASGSSRAPIRSVLRFCLICLVARFGSFGTGRPSLWHRAPQVRWKLFSGVIGFTRSAVACRDGLLVRLVEVRPCLS
jgi:hypothetical protein